MTVAFRRRAGAIEVGLDPAARMLLATLPGWLSTVGRDVDDPAVRRLSPPGVLDDPAADLEFRRLTGSDLDAARAADRETFEATVRTADVLSEADAEAWLRVIGDARLALAARAGVTVGDDEGWERSVDERPELGMVAWLGAVQELLVEAMMEEP